MMDRKRIIPLVLTLVMLFSFAACGKETAGEENSIKDGIENAVKEAKAAEFKSEKTAESKSDASLEPASEPTPKPTPEPAPLPTITVQPSSATAAAGSTATFSVTADNAESYQWQYRKSASGTWTNITSTAYTGMTTATMTAPATADRNGYQYRCRVSNAVGTIDSDAVTMTVVSAGKPTITAQPTSVTAAAGSTATFSVKADNADSFQWQYRKNSSGDWVNITNNAYTGLKTATMTAPATTDRNGYQFRCVVSNAAGTTNSDVATMTVTSSGKATIIGTWRSDFDMHDVIMSEMGEGDEVVARLFTDYIQTFICTLTLELRDDETYTFGYDLESSKEHLSDAIIRFLRDLSAQETGQEMTDEEFASKFGMPLDQFAKYMLDQMSSGESFDGTYRDEGDKMVWDDSQDIPYTLDGDTLTLALEEFGTLSLKRVG